VTSQRRGASRSGIRSVLASAFALGVLLLACAAPGATPTPSNAASPSPIDPEAVRVGAALEQIRGHHLASLELFEAGDATGSLAHATHPVAEIIDSIRSDLGEAGVDVAALEAALQGVIAASQGTSDEALSNAIDTSDAAVQGATDAVGGSTPSNAYVGSVIASLLSTAGHEYSEAVVDGAVVETVEYQDAYAFIQRAHDLWHSIEAAVVAANAEEAEEIEEAFDLLTSSLPGVTPPATLASIEDVEDAAHLIGHELEEVVGALPVTEADPAAEQAAIEELLDQVLMLVESDQRDAAAEVVAEIYLEHYEVIEAGVIAAAPDINAELEPLLGAGLRQQIRDGESLETITASVERAKTLLAQAVEALEGH
jgi:hypothetical protein